MLRSLLSCYKRINLMGVVFFLLASPLLFYVLPLFLAKLLPDQLYYTPLTFYSHFYEVTPLIIILPLLAWPILMGLGLAISGIKGRAQRYVTFVLTLAVLPGAIALFFYMAPQEWIGAIFLNSMTNNRVTLGHPMCSSPLLVYVDRCEGRNRGFMQARLNAVAIYGDACQQYRQSHNIVTEIQAHQGFLQRSRWRHDGAMLLGLL